MTVATAQKIHKIKLQGKQSEVSEKRKLNSGEGGDAWEEEGEGNFLVGSIHCAQR